MSVLAALVANRGTVWSLFVLVAAGIPGGRVRMGRTPSGKRAKQHGCCDQQHVNFCEMPHRLTYEMREREERHASDKILTKSAHPRKPNLGPCDLES
jgi:hypothetical protein